mmetsp:Transcript_38541/g.125002  ORF Transcript_38541/g.125002 Transcript_38541/m.125002 type:complete len:471 (-) Transcript_38541:144-1556(-)
MARVASASPTTSWSSTSFTVCMPRMASSAALRKGACGSPATSCPNARTAVVRTFSRRSRDARCATTECFVISSSDRPAASSLSPSVVAAVAVDVASAPSFGAAWPPLPSLAAASGASPPSSASAAPTPTGSGSGPAAPTAPTAAAAATVTCGVRCLRRAPNLAAAAVRAASSAAGPSPASLPLSTSIASADTDEAAGSRRAVRKPASNDAPTALFASLGPEQPASSEGSIPTTERSSAVARARGNAFAPAASASQSSRCVLSDAKDDDRATFLSGSSASATRRGSAPSAAASATCALEAASTAPVTRVCSDVAAAASSSRSPWCAKRERPSSAISSRAPAPTPGTPPAASDARNITASREPTAVSGGSPGSSATASARRQSSAYRSASPVACVGSGGGPSPPSASAEPGSRSGTSHTPPAAWSSRVSATRPRMARTTSANGGQPAESELSRPRSVDRSESDPSAPSSATV